MSPVRHWPGWGGASARMTLVAAGGLPRPWGRAAGVDGQSRGGLSRPRRRLYAALMRGPDSAGRTVLSQSEDQNHPHPVLTFVHPMSTQVRSLGLGAVKGGPRSDPQIATRARTGSADRRQTAQRAACGDVLCRAEHFVHRATSCAEGNESRSPSAQSVTLCAKCHPGRRTGPLHQEAGNCKKCATPPAEQWTSRLRPPASPPKTATGPADGPPKTAQTQQRKAPVTAPRRPPTSWASSPHYTGRRRPAGAGCGPLSRPQYRGRELL